MQLGEAALLHIADRGPSGGRESACAPAELFNFLLFLHEFWEQRRSRPATDLPGMSQADRILSLLMPDADAFLAVQLGEGLELVGGVHG
jgi:hypothetical protein